MGWNLIDSFGFRDIGEGMTEYTELRVIDMSHNVMGGDEENIGCQEWVSVFEKDGSCPLIHIDLSFNNFDRKQIQILSTGLSKNQGIIGVHIRGNHGFVDCVGNIILDQPQQQQDLIKEELALNFQINGVKYLKSCHDQLINCWICEGWMETTFIWKPHQSGVFDCEPIFIHFDFDGFLPHAMKKDESVFVFKKMCPPNTTINYFFHHEGAFLHAKNQKSKKVEKANQNVLIPFSDTQVQAFVPLMNFKQIKVQEKIIEKDYSIIIECRPRIDESIKYLKPKKIIKIPWTFEKSIFRDYKKDDEILIENCFEKDWGDSKIQKILPSHEIKAAKDLLKKSYRDIKMTYKYYASHNPNGEVWSIGANIYNELMLNTKIQSQNYGNASISLYFVNTNAANIQQKRDANEIFNNPQNCLVRYQFMEVLVRNIC